MTSNDGVTDPTAGMIEIRHVPGSTQAAYDRIHASRGLRQPDDLWSYILDLMTTEPGMRLLDVACGEGQLVRQAAGRGLEAHGIDLSFVAAWHARAPGVLAVAGDGERLPYPDRYFDRVLNFGSLEHYQSPGTGAAEIARVLAPEGLAVLQLPNSFGLRWSVMHAWRHGDVADDGQPIQRYATRGQWTRLLERSGLGVEDVLPYEDWRLTPRGPLGWLGTLRHPSRLLIPLMGRLPLDMASMFLFICRKV